MNELDQIKARAAAIDDTSKEHTLGQAFMIVARSQTDVPTLIAALDAVTTLHTPVLEDAKPVGCMVCDWDQINHATPWPCPTLEAIAKALEATD